MMLQKAKCAVSRRRFLFYAAAHSTLTAIYPNALIAANKLLPPQNNQLLRFADIKGLGPDMSGPDVERLYRPLHSEKRVPASESDASELESVKQFIQQIFLREGQPWKDHYDVAFTYQHYGVDDDSVYADQLLHYCQNVHDFTYSELRNLFDADVSWRRLNENEAQRNEQPNGFVGIVGRYTYYVMRAVVLHGPKDVELPYLVRAWPVERAIHYIEADKTSEPDRGTIYVIPGATSLVSPFSELLHLTFHGPSERYALQLSQSEPALEARQEAKLSGETITEATAIVLASTYMEKLNHSEKLSAIRFMTNSLASDLPLLPKAISYIKQNTLQSVVDQYREDPSGFMKTLRKT
jgi:hypothetical protein